MKPPEVVDGWLVSTVSSKTPFSELPAKTIRALLIFHAASVIKTDDLAGQGFFTNLDILVQYAERGVPPYIDIQQ